MANCNRTPRIFCRIQSVRHLEELRRLVSIAWCPIRRHLKVGHPSDVGAYPSSILERLQDLSLHPGHLARPFSLKLRL